MINKKGAMFGLDARIALAIFGALSVISGAALYSAIQGSKATAFLVDMQEVAKAYEAYYLDTSEHLKTDSANASGLYLKIASDLVNKPANINGWSGPYLSYKTNSFYLEYPSYNNLHIAILADNDTSWGKSTAWTSGYCTTGKTCALYVMINGVTDESMLKTVDKKVDGSDDSTSGNFKYTYYTNPANSFAAMLKIMPIKNPND